MLKPHQEREKKVSPRVVSSRWNFFQQLIMLACINSHQQEIFDIWFTFWSFPSTMTSIWLLRVALVCAKECKLIYVFASRNAINILKWMALPLSQTIFALSRMKEREKYQRHRDINNLAAMHVLIILFKHKEIIFIFAKLWLHVACTRLYLLAGSLIIVFYRWAA